jgi:phosphoserine phosphatase
MVQLDIFLNAWTFLQLSASSRQAIGNIADMPRAVYSWICERKHGLWADSRAAVPTMKTAGATTAAMSARPVKRFFPAEKNHSNLFAVVSVAVIQQFYCRATRVGATRRMRIALYRGPVFSWPMVQDASCAVYNGGAFPYN